MSEFTPEEILRIECLTRSNELATPDIGTPPRYVQPHIEAKIAAELYTHRTAINTYIDQVNKARHELSRAHQFIAKMGLKREFEND